MVFPFSFIYTNKEYEKLKTVIFVYVWKIFKCVYGKKENFPFLLILFFHFPFMYKITIIIKNSKKISYFICIRHFVIGLKCFTNPSFFYISSIFYPFNAKT